MARELIGTDHCGVIGDAIGRAECDQSGPLARVARPEGCRPGSQPMAKIPRARVPVASPRSGEGRGPARSRQPRFGDADRDDGGRARAPAGQFAAGCYGLGITLTATLLARRPP